MSLKNFIVIPVIGCGLFIFVNGCAHLQDPGSNAPAQYGNELRSEQYSTEISRLEQTAGSDQNSLKRSQAHLQLAYLHASYKNPNRNYRKALEHLEIYAALYPPFADDQNLRNWLLALKQINRQSQEIEAQNKKIQQQRVQLDKLRQKNSALAESNKRLVSANSTFKTKNLTLTQSNMELAKTIEMLKNIDRHVEEKRKIYNEPKAP